MFTNRKATVARIWQSIAPFPDAAQPAPDVAPAKGKAKKSPTKATARASRVLKKIFGTAERKTARQLDALQASAEGLEYISLPLI